MRKKLIYLMFTVVYGFSGTYLLLSFSGMNAVSYLTWMICPQIVCMLVYWIGAFLMKPSLKVQRMTVVINAALYSAFILSVSQMIKRIGGIETLIQNSEHLSNGGVQISLDQSPILSMLMIITFLSIVQYVVGKLLSKPKLQNNLI
ncbi:MULTISPECIES: hypothetical protein [unclassified Fusibacter]|uniref:hypothetical protein n=1 Tax=unclassified Fusibacter TaxID=2624464 RepID=UPI00101208A7|nr:MULTISPECIES: hypothetical protein [unclassified Fusibacter]MCK8061467.1 hypothetical protein [Fusibacter sp. A2]NPE23652.1 hypothetical protein [Fusibacter sp. A1]RXV58831.1 hypothetical protein DWB64_17860 [Fusibacter sp. A1]